MSNLKPIQNWDDVPEIQEAIATRIAIHAQSKEDQFFVDPATILVLINCIISVIRLLYVCKSKESIAESVNKPTYVEKFLLHRQVKKNFPKKQVKAVYNSMITVCKQLSEKEIKELLGTIKEKK